MALRNGVARESVEGIADYDIPNVHVEYHDPAASDPDRLLAIGRTVAEHVLRGELRRRAGRRRPEGSRRAPPPAVREVAAAARRAESRRRKGELGHAASRAGGSAASPPSPASAASTRRSRRSQSTQGTSPRPPRRLCGRLRARHQPDRRRAAGGGRDGLRLERRAARQYHDRSRTRRRDRTSISTSRCG